MTKHETDDSPADIMLDQALSRADRVSPVDGSKPAYSKLEEHVEDIGHMTAAHLRLTAPIIKSFHNGGVPSKPAGSHTLSLGPMSVRVSPNTLITLVTRVLIILFLLAIFAIVRGMDVRMERSGIHFQKSAPGAPPP